MSEWREITLGDLGRVVTGKTPSTAVSEYFGGDVPFVTPSDMDGSKIISRTQRKLTKAGVATVKSSFIPKGSVMVSCIASDMGKATIAAHDCVTNQQINSIIVSEDFCGGFVYYNLSTRKAELQSMACSGSAQPILNKGHFSQLPITIPSLPEQRAIASMLGALDDKIELNRRMNETLEALAQSLFKSWFVDATQSALPQGWREATISEMCDINAWTLGKADELDHIEYVEISEVMRGNIANIQAYERGEEPSRARRRLRHGDTVLSTVRPDRGAYFLCLNPSPNLIGSTGFAVLTPTKVPWSFIHAAMTQPDVFEFLGQQADGGAYPAVRPEIIGALEVALPGKSEVLESFHRACAPLYERAENNRRESRTLAALRDALLPKLLSGELRVPIAAKLVEAHA